MNPPYPSAAVTASSACDALDALRWEDSGYAQLGPEFFSRVAPQPLPAPYLVGCSADAAWLLGLPAAVLADPSFAEFVAGNRVPAGADPLAAVYAGHQFGVYVPQLGDGRALLIGSLHGPDGRWELQWKGSGRTPYSRMGDGRAVLRSSIREFLCSEAMAGLGVPTTRALAIAGADAPVRRETVETAAVVIRVAPSFVRFGSFEYFAHSGRHAALRRLADHVIDAFYPECRAAGDGARPYLALLEAVARRTAALVARWQAVGFCHGVLNTDNLSILGLTLDYGPFGFVEGFDPLHVCNHSDQLGRYAYARQPPVVYWNLHCLAQALLPLTQSTDATVQALQSFETAFDAAIEAEFAAKLGLATRADGDQKLLEDLLMLLAAQRVDWTSFWRRLSGLSLTDPAAAGPRRLFAEPAAFDAWAQAYRARLRAEGSIDAARAARMDRVNPKYVLRNHLAETAIRQARGDDGGGRDFSEVAALLACLHRPYDEQPEFERYAQPAPDWAADLQLSCSS